MGITLLGGENFIGSRETGIPAANGIVMEFSTKSFQGGICQIFAAGMPQERTNAVDMHHTTGNPGFPVPLPPRSTIIAQIVRTAAGRRKLMTEGQQTIPDFG